MNITLNYALIYGSPISEVLVAKLTSFYNKAILNYATKMIFLMPDHSSMDRADLHKAMFDELVVAKFDPAKRSFWDTKELYKFVCFLNMGSSLENKNCYIDHGKLFKKIELPDADLVVARNLDDIDNIRHANSMLSKHCGLPSLSDSELVLYDFSFCYMSDDLQSDLRQSLKKIIQTYPEYIDTLSNYSIISCAFNHLMKAKNYTVETLKETPQDITHSPMINDFYTLI